VKTISQSTEENPPFKVSVILLALLGLAVLVGDLLGDVAFFSRPEMRTSGLMVSAGLRNFLTLGCVLCLFFNRKWAAYLILLAALLGLWRRLSYLFPLMSSSYGEDWLLVHSGLDLGFRLLLVGVGIGWFLARRVSRK
jgi:hypothetical protein